MFEEINRMNAPHHFQSALTLNSPAPVPQADADAFNLAEYWDIFLDHRWIIAACAAVALTIGVAYALLAAPVYESDILIQVEDSSGGKGLLGGANDLFDLKTPAATEIEILGSRLVVGAAVDKTRLFIDAHPRYLPVVGEYLSRKAKKPSTPGLFGLGDWVSGSESIVVDRMEVPAELEGSRFRVTANGNGRFLVAHPSLQQQVQGAVGTPLTFLMPEGRVEMLITSLVGQADAGFEVTRNSRLQTIQSLQDRLKITEKGRQTGIIDAVLQDVDRERLALVLSALGQEYLRQNVERKAAEAAKTLEFLQLQLPQLQRQLRASEDIYSQYRNRQGTVALDEEARLALRSSAELEGKLLELQQRRRELTSRFTSEHPTVKTLDEQIGALRQERAAVEARLRAMPSVQQDAVRLERDVKVNTDLYQQLRNNQLQLELVREGKVGTVRLIDAPTRPLTPVQPKRAIVIAAAAFLGLFLGAAIALARNAFFRGLRSAQEIEAATGLNVYSTIPLSKAQHVFAEKVQQKHPGLQILSSMAPQDPAVESLRSLRTALQFAMLEAGNNCVLITGATPGVGKSFVSANFASVLANGGKRVLLIDADLRRGHLNQYFGMGRGIGLSELVARGADLDQAVRRNVLENLDLITTGTLPPNPAELVASASFANMLRDISGEYDVVIVDTPPVLVAADTLSIAGHVGTVLLVARDGQTQLGELNESIRRLAHAGTGVTGVLFNAVDLTRRHAGSYGYRYGGYKYTQYAYESKS